MTNGAVPMGGVITSRKVYDGFMSGPESAVELMHGYTYSGHPLASIDVYEEQDLFARAAKMAVYWEVPAHSLKGEPHVVDIRTIGLLAAIELAPKDEPMSRSAPAGNLCFDAGVLLRTAGDALVLSPPLIISESEIDRIFETIRKAVRSLA